MYGPMPNQATYYNTRVGVPIPNRANHDTEGVGFDAKLSKITIFEGVGIHAKSSDISNYIRKSGVSTKLSLSLYSELSGRYQSE